MIFNRDNIISLLAIAAIFISSIVQFHHHSHDGDIHIGYGILIETLLSHDSHHHETCTHDDATSASEKDDCSLKLSIVNYAASNNTTHLPNLIALPLLLIFSHIPGISDDNNSHTYFQYYKNILTHPFKIGTSGLRSPPVH